MNTWTNPEGDLGPRQAADFNKAWRALANAHDTYRMERNPSLTVTVFSLAGNVTEGERAAKMAIGEKYHWTVNKKTVRAIIAEVKAATAERLANCPCETEKPCGCNGAVPHKSGEHKARYVAPEDK